MSRAVRVRVVARVRGVLDVSRVDSDATSFFLRSVVNLVIFLGLSVACRDGEVEVSMDGDCGALWSFVSMILGPHYDYNEETITGKIN